MTIEIKNIPEGQKIKSISFNIDFESGTSETFVKLPTIDTSKQYVDNMPRSQGGPTTLFPNNQTMLCDSPVVMTPTIDTTKTTGVNVGPTITSSITEERPPKIDSDMLDGQF